MFKVKNRNTRTTPLALTCFAPCSSVSIVNSELVNVSWDSIAFVINGLTIKISLIEKRTDDNWANY